jgi:hypothetical protein
MTRRFCAFLVLTVATYAIASGCGDDKKRMTGPEPLLDLRDGTWGVVLTDSTFGEDPACLVETVRFAGPIPLCNLDALAQADTTNCQVEEMEGSFSLDCQEMVAEGSCTTHIHTTGTVTFTDTSFEFTVTITEITFNPPPCQADPCGHVFHARGNWLFEGGDCPSSPLPPVLQERLLQSIGRLGRARAAS